MPSDSELHGLVSSLVHVSRFIHGWASPIKAKNTIVRVAPALNYSTPFQCSNTVNSCRAWNKCIMEIEYGFIFLPVYFLLIRLDPWGLCSIHLLCVATTFDWLFLVYVVIVGWTFWHLPNVPQRVEPLPRSMCVLKSLIAVVDWMDNCLNIIWCLFVPTYCLWRCLSCFEIICSVNRRKCWNASWRTLNFFF